MFKVAIDKNTGEGFNKNWIEINKGDIYFSAGGAEVSGATSSMAEKVLYHLAEYSVEQNEKLLAMAEIIKNLEKEKKLLTSDLKHYLDKEDSGSMDMYTIYSRFKKTLSKVEDPELVEVVPLNLLVPSRASKALNPIAHSDENQDEEIVIPIKK